MRQLLRGLRLRCRLIENRSSTILAAGFTRSLSYQICTAVAPHLNWERIDADVTHRPCTPRHLEIRYFSEHRGASRTHFDSLQGKAALGKIAAYLSLQSEFIWTCNKTDRPVFGQALRRNYLTPHQAGSNSWSHINAAAIIYSAKPDPFEAQILEERGIDADAVIQTRERETIYQFVSRTSIRDPDSGAPVIAYVFDRKQAEALQSRFDEHPHVITELTLIDLGFGQVRPIRSSLQDLSEEQKIERKRSQARERKQRERKRNRDK
jgi:hypothetical protein